MLDWTTSFLSDAYIIKLTVQICQILSIGSLLVGVALGSRSTDGGSAKNAPQVRCGAPETKPNRGNSPDLEITLYRLYLTLKQSVHHHVKQCKRRSLALGNPLSGST